MTIRLLPVALGLGAVFVITVMNGMIKALSPGYGTAEVAFLRYLSGGLFALALAGVMRPGWPRADTLIPHIVRGFLGVTSGTLFFYALRTLSLADAFTIGFLAPLFMVIFGMIFLKERPRGVDLVALGLGFAGMLVIAQGAGGGGERPWVGILACALSALCYALVMIMLRSLAQKEALLLIVLYQHWIAALLLAPMALMDWQPPPATDLALFFVAAALGVGGHLMFARAYSMAPAAQLAPLEYSALIYAATLDFVWFGTLVSTQTLVGAGLIILGVLITSRR